MSEYFLEPKSSSKRVKVELHLSNYAKKKVDLKRATGADTSKSAKKNNLGSLKSEIDKLDIEKLEKVPTGLNCLKSKVDKLDVDKLVPVPIDLSKLSDAVKSDGVKNTEYNTKIKDIEDKIPDITNLRTNTTLTAEKNGVKNEIPGVTNLATTAAFNAKINEIKNKIPNVTNLATNAAPATDENKMPDHSKYITTPEFNKLIAENFTSRLKQANLATKGNVARFIKKENFNDELKKLNKKVTSNKSKYLLVENKFKNLQDKKEKLQTYDSSLFIVQTYFFNGGAQLYLIFQLFYYTLKRQDDTEKVVSWKYTPTTTANSLSPSTKCTQIQSFV